MQVNENIRTQDLKLLFRAQEVIHQLDTRGLAAVPSLEPAITLVRDSLHAQKGRRRYLLDMLPDSIAHALPAIAGKFVVHFPHSGSVELKGHAFPVLAQILRLEGTHGERAIRLVLNAGIGLRDREYWL